MSKLRFDLSMSLDGYVAGPNPTLKDPLGDGGEQLHEWAFAAQAWQERHGQEGGQPGPDSDVIEEITRSVGATIMGRRMFSGGSGPWDADPMASGWWGDEPPFHHPVFVLTHHPRPPLALKGTTFTFVTEGIHAALDQARAAAAGKDVTIGGGGEAARQYLAAGLVDEFQVHLVPIFLGGGTRLFTPLDAPLPRIERTQVVDSPTVTHLRYRVVR